jgi:hypothetical protein
MTRNNVFRTGAVDLAIYTANSSFNQLTKTLHGTITNREDFKKTSFTTPNGSIDLVTTRIFFRKAKPSQALSLLSFGNKIKDKDKILRIGK